LGGHKEGITPGTAHSRKTISRKVIKKTGKDLRFSVLKRNTLREGPQNVRRSEREAEISTMNIARTPQKMGKRGKMAQFRIVWK